jgi:hypothetical protein
MKDLKCVYKFDGKNVTKNGIQLGISKTNNKGFNRLLMDLGEELSINDGLIKGLYNAN